MRRLTAIFLILVFAFNISISSIQSDFSDEEQNRLDREYDTAHEVYRATLEDYNKKHNDYVKARAQFFQFDTLTARNNAKEATRNMLQARDQVIIDYLEAVRKKILSIDGIEDFRRDGMLSTINDEQSWHRSHKDRLNSAGTLESLVEDSEEAFERWGTLEPTLYVLLSEIPYGRVNKFQERLDSIFTSTREKVLSIREEERPEYQLDVDKLERIDRMVFETEGRYNRSKDGLFEIRTEIDELSQQRNVNAKRHSNIVLDLAESTQDLKEASLFMKEVIREIITE